MKVKKYIYLTIIFMMSVTPLIGEVTFTGYVRNYTAVFADKEKDGGLSYIQNTLNLNIEGSKESVAFKVNPYIYNYYDKTSVTLGIREAYMDMYFNKFDLRIGKQQIIWGKADGVFITDIVSPKDLREFILPDFEEIRLGVTSLKFDMYIKNSTFEAVWIPIFTPDILPDNDSIWHTSFTSKLNLPVTPIIDESKMEVSKKLRNSDVFVKYSVMTSLVDFELMGGYAYNDEPTPHITRIINPLLHTISQIIVTPEYHRVSIGGGSFSTTIGGVVFRGEGAYYNGKYFITSDLSDADGVVPRPSINYLLGVDFSIFDIKFSTQFIQQVILDYSDSLIDDEYQNMATALISKTFLRETLRVELFGYFELNDNNDSLIRPKISYELADGFNILIGANIFNGDSGMFGQYDKNDMIYTKVKYSF